jgi:predicted phosphodiesterase
MSGGGRVQRVIAWTPEEYAYLLEMMERNPDHTYRQYAEALTRRFGREFTAEAVRSKLKRAGSQKAGIHFLDRKNAEEHDPETLLSVVIQAQREFQKLDDRQTSVTIEIDDDKPIGICFSGDWHLGGLYTDHEQLRLDSEIIGATDGLYNVLMGDYTDNYITRSHPGGSFEQVITADKQKELCEYFFTRYYQRGNLAVLKGNHDQWSVKETGEDFVKYLARKIGSPYLWYGGEIVIRLGEVTYRIHAHHSYRYNSSLNTTNSQRNLFAATHADIIALGHIHTNETHAKTVGGKDTVWMRTGSYKITDDYSQWLGGLKGDPRVPMCVLFPDRKKIVDFRDMYDGIEYLMMKRANLVMV